MALITPTLAEVLRTAVESYLLDLHVALPCKVESYDLASQTADVKPQIKRTITKEDGTFLHEALPVIPKVPIAFPRGGDWFVSMPIAAGDFVFVVCSERSLDQWREKGKDTEAGDLRTHTLDGAVAFPANLYPSSEAIGDAHASKMVIGKDGGAKIYIDSDSINIYEETASQFVALAQKTFDEINALRTSVNDFVTVFNTHTHPETGGTTLTPTAPATAPSAVNSVAASKVKAT